MDGILTIMNNNIEPPIAALDAAILIGKTGLSAAEASYPFGTAIDVTTHVDLQRVMGDAISAISLSAEQRVNSVIKVGTSYETVAALNKVIPNEYIGPSFFNNNVAEAHRVFLTDLHAATHSITLLNTKAANEVSLGSISKSFDSIALGAQGVEKINCTIDSFKNEKDIFPVSLGVSEKMLFAGALLTGSERIAEFAGAKNAAYLEISKYGAFEAGASAHNIIECSVIEDTLTVLRGIEVSGIDARVNTLTSDVGFNTRGASIGVALPASDYKDAVFLGLEQKSVFAEASATCIKLYEDHRIYSGVAAQLFASPKYFEAIPLSVARLSGNEYFNEANLIGKIAHLKYPSFVNHPKLSYGDDVLSEEIKNETQLVLQNDLPEINKNLYNMWKGAKMTLISNNPDKIRQGFTSLRELFTQVIHAKAPTKAVEKWNKDPSLYHNGSPTRRARLLYIARNIVKPEWRNFFEADIENMLSLMDILNASTHSISPGEGEHENIPVALLQRFGSAIVFILDVDSCNS